LQIRHREFDSHRRLISRKARKAPFHFGVPSFFYAHDAHRASPAFISAGLEPGRFLSPTCNNLGASALGVTRPASIVSSLEDLSMLTFRTLWDNHPSVLGETAPCRDKKGNSNFANQCAIRMGAALSASGMNLASFRGARCWFGHGHILRVEEMIKWLRGQTQEVGTAVSYKPGSNAAAVVKGKTGIVACRNFWGAGNQGDHIDLFDGVTMAQGDAAYMDRSEEVVFWEIK
jgi:hypothetical protein